MKKNSSVSNRLTGVAENNCKKSFFFLIKMLLVQNNRRFQDKSRPPSLEKMVIGNFLGVIS